MLRRRVGAERCIGGRCVRPAGVAGGGAGAGAALAGHRRIRNESVNEASLCGVGVVLRPSDDIATFAGDFDALFSNAKLFAALQAALLAADESLLVSAEAADGGPAATHWFLAVPLAGPGAAVILRQLIPTEKRQLANHCAAAAADVAPDDDEAVECAAAMGSMAAAALDEDRLPGNVAKVLEHAAAAEAAVAVGKAKRPRRDLVNQAAMAERVQRRRGSAGPQQL